MSYSAVRRVMLLVALVTLVPAVTLPTHAAGTPVTTQDLSVDFGDWQSLARLTYPAASPCGSPTVILVHGQGPVDLDHTVILPDDPQVISTNFRDIATYVAARGIAALRFNKHYVTSAGEVDGERFGRLTLTDQLADLEHVLALAKANSHVDGRRVFVYAWSEGTLLAAALAVRHPELAGVILQGPVATTERDYYIEDYTEVALPYLLQFAPDGIITPAALQAAYDGPGGWFARLVGYFDFSDPSSSDELRVNPFFDTNGDGALDVEQEIRPRLGAWVDLQLEPGGVLAGARQLPSVSQQAPNIQVPVLVLQGENDASTRAKWVGVLDAAFAAHREYTLLRYAGLGHSLGPATSLIDDNLRPIVEPPLADAVHWIQTHAASVATPDSRPLLFPETGYCLEGTFVPYWRANGGLAVFGYPIATARHEDGHTVQYLERVRLETEAATTGQPRVQLGRLGVEVLEQQGRRWQTLPTASPDAPHYFLETGHAISHEPFWRFWSSYGRALDGRPDKSRAKSVALFGYPISEAQMETTPDGATVLTQWFERARFEYHPSNPAGEQVLLGRLGVELQAATP